ncbi:hypothetical protein [Streptomyces sp. NPDC057623]|uniref:hypothetical protein n=1 Tax=Streptomyces sp. NPDC057623 TaxID=3346187 RepID=UPI0036B83247
MAYENPLGSLALTSMTSGALQLGKRMNITGAMASALVAGEELSADNIAPRLENMEPEARQAALEWLPNLDHSIPRELFVPVSLDDMRYTGRAGPLVFNKEEIDRTLSGVRDVAEPIGHSWMELLLTEDGRAVSCPQNDVAKFPELALWLPVPAGPDATRLVALDLGFTVGTEPGGIMPSLYGSLECQIQYEGSGSNLKMTCGQGTCRGGCKGSWLYIKGKVILVGCECPT